MTPGDTAFSESPLSTTSDEMVVPAHLSFQRVEIRARVLGSPGLPARIDGEPRVRSRTQLGELT